MKKTIQFGLLSMFAFLFFSASLSAQNIQKESLALTKKYENAYNKKDDQTLKAMYTEDAVRTINDSMVNRGNEAIRTGLALEFKALKLKLTINPNKSTIAKDGSMTATGAYHVWGKSATGETFDINGNYTNTLIKVNGAWKISRSELVQK